LDCSIATSFHTFLLHFSCRKLTNEQRTAVAEYFAVRDIQAVR